MSVRDIYEGAETFCFTYILFFSFFFKGKEITIANVRLRGTYKNETIMTREDHTRSFEEELLIFITSSLGVGEGPPTAF